MHLSPCTSKVVVGQSIDIEDLLERTRNFRINDQVQGNSAEGLLGAEGGEIVGLPEGTQEAGRNLEKQERGLREGNGQEPEEVDQLDLAAGLAPPGGQVISAIPIVSDNNQLLQRIASCLSNGVFHEDPADLFEKLREYRIALEYYHMGEGFARDVEKVRWVCPEDAVQLQRSFADFLVSVKEVEDSLGDYVETTKNLRELDAVHCGDGKLLDRAAGIINSLNDPNSVKIMAQHYCSTGAYDLAESLLVQQGMPREAIDMYSKIGKWDKAYKLASQYLGPEEVCRMNVARASFFEREGNYREAEKLYISVGQPGLAIAMYKNTRQYAHAIRLVKQYLPHSVIETCQCFAAQMEKEKNYVEAAQFYGAFGDWKAVVHMYCQGGMWEQAYRVADIEGTPIAAKQVAYLWAKTLATDSAVKLLGELGLLESAIEYASDTWNFDFAFDLSRLCSNRELIRDVRLKHAAFLEQEGRYSEAEQEYIKSRSAERAISMYISIGDRVGAQRVVKTLRRGSLADVLSAQPHIARRRPPLADNYPLIPDEDMTPVPGCYQAAGIWGSSYKCSKQYVPLKLFPVPKDCEAKISLDQELAKLYAEARIYQDVAQYYKAATSYMKIFPTKPQECDFVEKCWHKAADLCDEYADEKQKLKFIVDLDDKLERFPVFSPTLCWRLQHMVNFASIPSTTENWEEAKQVVVKQKHRFHMGKYRFQKTDQLGLLDSSEVLDEFAEKKAWDKCFRLALRGQTVRHHYISLCVHEFLAQNKLREIVDVYKIHGALAYPVLFSTYRRVTIRLFEMENSFNAASYRTWSKLRDVLHELCQDLKMCNIKELKEFNTMLTIAHYSAVRSACLVQPGLEEQVAKICITLLRYIDIIRPDKLFFEAGLAAKNAGWINMTLVFWSCYLNACEAIEEENPAWLNLAIFRDTDIPTHFKLPKGTRRFLNEFEHKKVEDWVLSMSDGKVKPVLRLDMRDTYEASLVSPNGERCHPCIITGYPVVRSGLGLGYNKVAEEDDYDKVIRNTTVPELKDVARFLDLWCNRHKIQCAPVKEQEH